MNLDRSLIKSQAKGLIKGNVFKFFVLIFVVTLLAGSGSVYSSATSVTKQLSDTFDSAISDNNTDEYGLNNMDEYDFDSFGSIEEFEDFANGLGGFQNEAPPQESKSNPVISIFTGGLGALASLMSIANLFLAPLAITLMGVFYQLIKGKNLGWSEEFDFVFRKTFDKNYWNKFLLNLLKGIFMVLLFCLFIIPGIIFYYKYYFTSYIMMDKPELSWKEAMNISKKMTNGHKGELFVLDLSFIGWHFLTAITCGLVGIYVLPYVYTTQALYYENFKIRAFQLGVMSEADYLTEGEKAAIAYGNVQQQQQGGFYQPPQQNAFQAPVQENVYQAPVQAQPQPEAYQPPVQQSVDYTYEKAENPVDTISQPPANEE